MRLLDEIGYGIFWLILIGIVIFNSNNSTSIIGSVSSLVSTNIALLQGRPVTTPGGANYGAPPHS